MKKDRGKVWLGVAGVVVNKHGQWLVVKKAYSGLKGRWSFPAGFVDEGETVDEAVVRELKEETGLDCVVAGLVGFRTGVIGGEISDNMAIFYCQMKDETQQVTIQEDELLEAKWLYPQELEHDQMSTAMLKETVRSQLEGHQLDLIHDIQPEEIFGYSTYKLFLKK